MTNQSTSQTCFACRSGMGMIAGHTYEAGCELTNAPILGQRIWLRQTDEKDGWGFGYYSNKPQDDAFTEYVRATTPSDGAAKEVLCKCRTFNVGAARAFLDSQNFIHTTEGCSNEPFRTPDARAARVDDELRNHAVMAAAREFVWEPENWEAYQDSKESNSVAWPPEFLLLAQAVVNKYGPMPIDDECFCGTVLVAGICPNGHDPIKPAAPNALAEKESS